MRWLRCFSDNHLGLVKLDHLKFTHKNIFLGTLLGLPRHEPLAIVIHSDAKVQIYDTIHSLFAGFQTLRIDSM